MQHLKALLVAKGKTQTDLASALGRNKSAITNLLQGKRHLKAQEISTIAEFLQISEAEVLGLADAPEPLTPVAPVMAAQYVPFEGKASPGLQKSGYLHETEAAMKLELKEPVSEHSFAMEAPDHSLDLNGILPGDIVIFDRSLPPASGDIVLVQVEDADRKRKMILRQYVAPFLEAHSTREGFERLHEERASVRIIAPLIRLLRYYYV